MIVHCLLMCYYAHCSVPTVEVCTDELVHEERVREEIMELKGMRFVSPFTAPLVLIFNHSVEIFVSQS